MESNSNSSCDVDASESSHTGNARKSDSDAEGQVALPDPLERKLRLAAALLDRSPLATLAVDDEGVVLHENGAAQGLLKKGEGLLVLQGVLSARQRDNASALSELIRATASSGQGGVMAITRPGKTRPLFVRMVPLPGREPSEPACVAIFVTDPEIQPMAAPTSLRALYGLSEAEARLTQVLLQEGRSLRDAAERCGVTLNTAKTQLKRVFDKTGTRRRSDLVSLVLRSVGPGVSA